MSIKTRLDKLEQRHSEDTLIVVSWRHDPTVTVKGETITKEEFNSRYPDATHIRIGWES